MDRFDLFLFDLDGVLVNTEQLHYEAYKEALCALKGIDIKTFEWGFKDYCALCHRDSHSIRLLVNGIIAERNLSGSQSWETFYRLKEKLFLAKLDTDSLQMIPGAHDLLTKLIQNNVNTCIVTHSPMSVLEKLQTRFPILAQVQKTVTKKDVKRHKPDPESYLKALHHFEYKNAIGFEDSFKGYTSLSQCPITPVFLEGESYVLEPELKPRPVYKFRDFSHIDWPSVQPLKHITGLADFLDKTVSIYRNHIDEAQKDFRKPLSLVLATLTPMLKEGRGNLFITGIGKCGHVARKCVSTWQSMGLSCQNLVIPDLFHGDFGILRKGDIVLYLSNSGNTTEMVQAAEYISTHFDVIQIALTFKKVCKISTLVDYHFPLAANPIVEIGDINMAPTTSSVLFMMFLDIVGVKIAENLGLTMTHFQLNHPGGELGKKVAHNVGSIDHVFVIAAGLGSRMYPLTKYVPKVLLTLWNHVFVERLVKYWSQYCKNIHIVVTGIYADLVRYYAPNCDVVGFDLTTGTADTIAKVVPRACFGQDVLFTWGDVLPADELDLSKFTSNLCITWGNECRYKVENKKLVNDKDSKGNVVGIYYIKNYKGVQSYNVGQDIADVFADNFGEVLEYPIKELIDIGDLPKYRATTMSKNSFSEFKVRFFNQITVTQSGSLLKQATNDQGKSIISKEAHWYQTVGGKYPHIPKVFQYLEGGFEMERLPATPLYKDFPTMDRATKAKTVLSILDSLEVLHNSIEKRAVDPEVRKRDISIECFDKIKSRVKDVLPVIQHFSPISRVNGVSIVGLKLEEVLSHCLRVVEKNTSTQYTVIHGDCQFSNTLYNPENGEIFFVDPRGYFGETLVYGLPEYDFAKVLYALSGYDAFNNSEEFHIKNYKDGDIDFDIQSEPLEWIGTLSNKLMSPATLALLVVVWIGLAQYSKDNVSKCVCSYYHGLSLYRTFTSNKLFGADE
eukprot:TRINITY_DN379_c0_g1_i12.p1 TRINITY_DN379_c0_g1~~TRINITY_DN379_c0_g1_i12.p1  ORF type:complete len:956 (+),score=193.72 TRINITY_DN379_c0_g1_i12:331-3198(+)